MSDDGYQSRVTKARDIDTATQARTLLRQTGQNLTETAAAITQLHDTVTERVGFSPAVIDTLDNYGHAARVHADGYGRDVEATVTGAHAEAWERIENGRPADEAWDVGKNRDHQ